MVLSIDSQGTEHIKLLEKVMPFFTKALANISLCHLLQHQQFSGYNFLYFIKVSKALLQNLAALFISIVCMPFGELRGEMLAFY